MAKRVVARFRVPEDRTSPVMTDESGVPVSASDAETFETFEIETDTGTARRVEDLACGVYSSAVDEHGFEAVDGVVLDAERAGFLAAYYRQRSGPGMRAHSPADLVSRCIGFDVYPVRNCGLVCEALVTAGKIAAEHSDGGDS